MYFLSLFSFFAPKNFFSLSPSSLISQHSIILYNLINSYNSVYPMPKGSFCKVNIHYPATGGSKSYLIEDFRT